MKDPQPQQPAGGDIVVPIKYIGAKPEKHDNVNHTGQVWKKGETHYYPAKYAKALLVHTAVWRIGRKEDVGKVSEDHILVVGAAQAVSAGDLEFGSWGGPTKDNEDESRPQSELVHDREGSTKQSRVSLE